MVVLAASTKCRRNRIIDLVKTVSPQKFWMKAKRLKKHDVGHAPSKSDFDVGQRFQVKTIFAGNNSFQKNLWIN